MLKKLLGLLSCLLLLGAPALAELSGRVSWVVDGDTLLVDGVGEVRLLGIDAPEGKDSARDNFYRRRFGIAPNHLRRIARRATRFMIQEAKGKRLRLEPGQPAYDQHARLLAYAYLPDGRLLNALLLEEGLAAVFRRYDFARKKDFLALEEAARQAGRGLWE